MGEQAKLREVTVKRRGSSYFLHIRPDPDPSIKGRPVRPDYGDIFEALLKGKQVAVIYIDYLPAAFNPDSNVYIVKFLEEYQYLANEVFLYRGEELDLEGIASTLYDEWLSELSSR